MKSFVVVLLAATALLTGCASVLKKLNEPKLNYADYAGEPVKSFYLYNMNGWAPVSEFPLLVQLICVNGMVLPPAFVRFTGEVAVTVAVADPVFAPVCL